MEEGGIIGRKTGKTAILPEFYGIKHDGKAPWGCYGLACLKCMLVALITFINDCSKLHTCVVWGNEH